MPLRIDIIDGIECFKLIIIEWADEYDDKPEQLGEAL